MQGASAQHIRLILQSCNTAGSIAAALESVTRCIPLCGLVQQPVFRNGIPVGCGWRAVNE
jgi:hypothetical protein